MPIPPVRTRSTLIRTLASTTALVALGLLTARPVAAQSQYWSPDGTKIGGGGSWSSSSQFLNPPNNAPGAWAGGTAVFAGIGGTVSVIGTQTFKTLSFTSGGYVLKDGLSGQLSFSSGRIDVSDNVTATISVEISSSAALIKGEGGTLILEGNQGFRGLQIINGTVQVAADGALGSSGTLVLGGGTLAASESFSLNRFVELKTVTDRANTFAPAAGKTLTLLQSVTGTGGLTLNGAGTLVLTGANTYKGRTVLNGGALQVDGSLVSEVLVQGAATLSGAGSYGALTLGDNATLSLGGSSPMTLKVGNVTLAASSTLQLRVDAAGQSDRLASSGTVSLAGATLSVLAGQGTYALKTRYTIVTAAGGVSGTFGQVRSNLALLTPTLSYEASGVVLTMTRNDKSLTDVVTDNKPGNGQNGQNGQNGSNGQNGQNGQNSPNGPQTRSILKANGLIYSPNTLSVADALQRGLMAADPDGKTPLVRALLNLDGPGLSHALAQLTGHVNAARTHMQTTLLPQVESLVKNRIGAGSGSIGGVVGAGLRVSGATLPAEYASDLPGRPSAPSPVLVKTLDPDVVGFWGEGFGSFGGVTGSRNAPRLNQNATGFIAGADITIAGASRFGLAGGYSEAEGTMSAVRSRMRTQTGYGIAYGSHALGPVILRGGLIYAGSNAQVNRTILFDGFSGTTSSKPKGSTMSVFVEAGLPIRLDESWVIEPYLGLGGVRSHADRFTESSGTQAALMARPDTSYRGSASFGGRAQFTFGDNGQYAVTQMLGYRHSFGSLNPTTRMAFAAAPGALFQVRGAALDAHAFQTETTFAWKVRQNVTLSLVQSGLYGPTASMTDVKGRIEMRF